MSRYAKDQNQWGAGDLNGAPSSVKTNGEQGKRFGPLGIGGVGGVVRKNGSEHEIIYELSGQEVLTEGGIPSTEVMRVELPDAVGRVESAIIKVKEAFALGDGAIVNLHAQATAGAPTFTKTVLIADAPLDSVGIADVTLGIVVDVFEQGGSMTFDFTDMSSGAGKAELIIKYTSL